MQQQDQDKRSAFLGRMVEDVGAIATGVPVMLGDRLGLYKAMQADDTRFRRAAETPFNMVLEARPQCRAFRRTNQGGQTCTLPLTACVPSGRLQDLPAQCSPV